MSSEDRSLSGVGRRFAEDTSISGVRRAARPGVVARIIWVLLIFAATAMTIYSLHRLYHVRSQRRPLVTSTVDDVNSQVFPDVTICNVEAISLSTLVTDESLAVQWKDYVAYTQRVSQQRESEAEHRAARFAYQSLVDQLSEDERVQVGHELPSMLMGCRFGDVPCNPSNFTHFYHHKYGNCYTFSVLPAYQPVFARGAQYGLTLNLKTNRPTEGIALQDESGFVVAVHEPRETVFLPEEGLYVPDGRAAYVAIAKSTDGTSKDGCMDAGSDRRHRHNNNIYDASNRWPYSQRGCQHGCLQRTLYSHCGCCDLDIPCPPSFLAVSPSSPLPIPRCSPKMDRCRQEVMRDYMAGSLPCLSQCQPRCRVTKYESRVTYTALVTNTPTRPPPIDFATSTKPTVQTSPFPMTNPSNVLTESNTQVATEGPVTSSQVPISSTFTIATRETTIALGETEVFKSSSKREVPTEGPIREEVPIEGSNREEVPTEGSNREEVPTEGSNRQEVPTERPNREEVPTEDPIGEEVQGVDQKTPLDRQTPDAFPQDTTLPSDQPLDEDGQGFENSNLSPTDQVFMTSRAASRRRKRRSSCTEHINGRLAKRQAPCGDDSYDSVMEGERVRVHVFFQTFRAQSTEIVEVNDWSEWMADIGGITSLWMGLSILGLLELVHALVELSVLACFKCCNGESRSPSPTRVKPLEALNDHAPSPSPPTTTAHPLPV